MTQLSRSCTVTWKNTGKQPVTETGEQAMLPVMVKLSLHRVINPLRRVMAHADQETHKPMEPVDRLLRISMEQAMGGQEPLEVKS